MPQAAAEEEGEEEDGGENDEERQQQTGQQRQQQNNSDDSSSDRGELKVVFSHVDPRDPPREFSLGLRLTGEGSRTYSVLRCEPPECLGPLRRLCDALNSSPDDFAWFVREVRAEFRARVADEASGGGRLL